MRILFLTYISHPQIILEALELKKYFNVDIIVIKKSHETRYVNITYVLDDIKRIFKKNPLNIVKLFAKNIPNIFKMLIKTRTPPYPTLEFLLYIFEYLYISEKIREKHYDIIYAHWAYPSGLIGLWLRETVSRSAKLVVSLWGYDIQRVRDREYGKRRYYDVFLKNVLLYADLVITNHEIHRRIAVELLHKYGRGKSIDKIIYLEPGIPDLSTKIPEDINNEDVKKFLERWNGKKIVLYAPSLKPIYGVLEFVKALSMILKGSDDVVSIIVGEGSLKQKAREIIEKEGLSKYVLFTGKIEHSTMLYLLREARVICDLSYMGPGTTTLEALCVGRPVIGVRGIKTIISHGVEGYLIERGDHVSLAKYMEILLRDDETWNKMSINARNTFLKKYHIENRIRKLTQIIRDLCLNH